MIGGYVKQISSSVANRVTGSGKFGGLVGKFSVGDAAGILRQFEDMGEDAIVSALGGDSSILATMFKSYLKTLGVDQRQSARDQKQKDKPLSAAQRRLSRQRHQEWLKDNRWRFDWRSQPRRPAGTDAGGEWMEGRLDYQAEQKNAYSRSVMRRRTRSMRQYKARMRDMGNTQTRTIRSAWGDF